MLKFTHFSIRTLFIVVLAPALVLGIFVVPGLRQSRCETLLLNAGVGVTIEYGEPAAPPWIVDLIGHNFFQPITRVGFVIDLNQDPLVKSHYSVPLETSVQFVESPEKLLPVLRQLHGLEQVTVLAGHHDAIVEQLQRELPGVEVLSITPMRDTVVHTGTKKPSETLPR